MDPTSGETARIVTDLEMTMLKLNGAGLAAPQIGEPASVFVIAPQIAGNPPGSPALVFVNPGVRWCSEEAAFDKEGCLSFPDIWLNVKRPVACKVMADGLDGYKFEVEAEGLYARALLHEIDHLAGRLMVDFVSKMKQEAVKKKMKRRKR